MMKTLKKVFIVFFEFIVLIALGATLDFDFTSRGASDFGLINEHAYEELPELELPDDIYISYSMFRNDIAQTSQDIMSINMGTWDKVIRFESADELYRFSMDVSYNLKYTTFETKLTQQAIARLLSLDYVLARDIDYSVMKSKRFNPIGYHFMLEDVQFSQTFTGTFDGNGFEISNLYVSGFDELTEVLYEGTELETEISYTEYYAMFAYNAGTIKNFGLINPTYEFNFESATLFKAANIVGKNFETGVVHHVYAIDYRATALVSGIRMVASAGQAAGIMFDNYGSFYDAYFAGRVVMNASYGSRFTVQPVLYQNQAGGTYSDLAYDDTLYQESVTVAGSTYNITVPNGIATSLTTSQIRSSNATLGNDWYYYPAESNPYAKYPTTFGLAFVTTPIVITLSDTPGDTVTLNSYYEIQDALDFIAFSKMLNYTRESGLTPFRELNYVITGDIDMRIVAANSYQTPSVEFGGVLAGIDDETYIYGLEIVNGQAQEAYYSGLFGVLLGRIYNLVFFDAKVTLTETESFAGVPTYVGLIAGQLKGGIIRNVLADVTIDLGHKTLGELHVGGLVGDAYGLIKSVYVEGDIIGQADHVYRTDILINPTYYMGGVVGSALATQLVLLDANTTINISGIGTSSTGINASTAPKIYIGGILGYAENSVGQEHMFGMFSASGMLKVEQMTTPLQETYYIGGLIGQSSGKAYVLSQTFGKFYNKTTIDPKNRGTNQVVAAGILTSNHSEAVEFVHLFNESDASLDYYVDNGGSITGNFNNLSYTTLINNVGGSLTLSQAKNSQSINLYDVTDFSGLYYSSNDSYTLLRFVENTGHITYANQTMGQTTRIAGITLSTNVDYLNVTYNGEIKVYNVTMQTNTTTAKQLFVSGFSETLTMNRYIKNSLVNGKISVSGITTNTVNRTPQNNIFIGGFVNKNSSGNMDPNGNLSMPVATIGILNSINSANITSTEGAYRGITGHANVFVGGLATFNDGDIQDSANLGDIRFENLSAVDTSNVTFNTTSTEGGATTKFRYGIITGGISAAVISYKSRIYDSSNNGTIIALSKNFTRAGGILGMAIHNELINGNVTTGYSSSNSNIQNSILSNCINYGIVSGLTISISIYATSYDDYVMSGGIANPFRYDFTQPVDATGYQNSYYSTLSSGSVRLYTRDSTEERPGINAAAGGVIGYGLSIMRRMVNHGQISSTDVAGGVVGATVVFATAYVKIDTAINYGTVRAFDRGTQGNNWTNFNSVDIMDYESIRDHFYPVDSTFIFPNTMSDIRLYPENKRGFGGIFGRLQRAANQFMYGNNDSRSTFNFIVNMDPNVDLIGRLDQVLNFYSSLRYFDFTNSVYYSARKHDTTQAVFTGISYFYDNSNSSGNSLTAIRTQNNISITSYKYEYTYNGTTGQWMRTTYQRRMTNRTEIELYGRRYYREGYDNADYDDYQSEIISRSAAPAHSSSGWTAVSGSTKAVGTLEEYKYEHDLPHYNQVWDDDSTKVINSSSSSAVPNGYYLFGVSLPVPLITEEVSDNVGEYVYGSTFPMITDSVLQQYIYYAENGNLSPTFINARPNGMYVLATSSGSTFGSILPANLKFDRLLPLYANPGELPLYSVDYDHPTRIMASSNPLYTSLQADYQELFQTVYSDKSELLDESEDTLELIEDEGSNTKLYDPTFVQPTSSVSRGIITFNLNLATLDFTQSNLNTVTYRLSGEQLPINAVIAKTMEDYYGQPYGSNMSAYVSDYQGLLKDYANPDIPIEEKENLEPSFSYTFNINNPQTGIRTIGYFTSYSQVAQEYASFLNDSYVTDYEVRLNVSYNQYATMPYLYSYQIDGGTTRTQIVTNITAEPIDNTLTFNFRDPGSILPMGTDIKTIGTANNDNVVLEYYNPATGSYVLVDYSDFGLSTSPLQIVRISGVDHRQFTFTLAVNPQLKAGQYRVGFVLLPYQTTKTYYTFQKGSSTLRNLTEIEHYSSGIVNPSTTTFQTYVNFGYVFDFSHFTPTAVTDSEALPYKSEVLYYTLPFIDRLKISEFAEITNVIQNATTYTAQGFRIYNIRYTIRSESGSSINYNHQIIERPISIVDVYRNNNKVVMNSSNPVIISREAVSTTVLINYGIDPLYSNLIYNLYQDDPTSYFEITPSDVLGITFAVTENYLTFTITEEALAGLYTFGVSYVRSGDSPINLGSVYIRKSPGTNAYLIDIQFAELATETNYAKIYVSDASGIPITGSLYNPSIYYAGIDYDGANTALVTNFRVDGQVSNIPLDEYIPFFLNYLPAGATIARKINSTTYSNEVSGPDDPDIAGLAADFTSQEGVSETEDIIITYRVTSEDGLHMVYYHITVTDVTYNVSYIFDVIYEGNTLKPNLNGVVVVINVRNMSTNLPVTDTIVSTLPQFTSVTGYENSTNLMYMLGFDTYKFRFGRNKSGFFSFNVKVLDPEGYFYDVKIELNGTDELQTISDMDQSSNDHGKYYYINSSTKNRTRNFVITISNAQIAPRDYGFTDDDISWD